MAKMLCIRGRVHPWHTGLFAGRTYDVFPTPACPGCGQVSTVHAEGSFFKRPVRLECNRCKRLVTFGHVPWSPTRFIPFNPDVTKVTEKESNALYKTHVDRILGKPKVKEKA